MAGKLQGRLQPQLVLPASTTSAPSSTNTMFSTKFILVIVSSLAGISAVCANTGFAKHWDPENQVGCGRTCPRPTGPRFVALPIDQVPNAAEKCCHAVSLAFEGKNIFAMFTEFYLGDRGSQNITLTDLTFSELAPTHVNEPAIFPVVWNVN